VTGVALLGAGFMARTHAAVYSSLPARAQVRVVCASAGAEAIASDFGAAVADDWEVAIAAEGVDAVDICLPTPLHRPAAERALAAGKHVLLEKPIALSLEDADAIGAAAGAAGRVLMVGHVLRYFPEIVELRRRLGSGDFGKPLAVTALRLSALPDWNEWMLDPEQSGGTLVDLMIHDFDICNALLGAPRRVHAVATAGGRHVRTIVEHEHGDATVEGSHAMPPSFPFTAGLRVLCERGVLDHRFEAGAGDEVADEAAASALAIHSADGHLEGFHQIGDGWGAEIRHFLDCVDAGAVPRDGSFAQARAALAIAMAAKRSIASGNPETVQ
jgi:predicted dehydrogenase